MVTCSQCGNQVNDGTRMCPSCGAEIGGGYAQTSAPVYNSGYNAAAQDVQNNKVMAVLAYLGILVLVPLLAAKESPFARYHANQGLVLCIASIVCNIVVWILGALAPLLGMVASLAGIAILALLIMGLINAAKGQMKPLPLIGGIQLLK